MDNTLRDQFLLDPDVAYLNHGSFGACPRPVFEVYQDWQRRLEHQPMEFLWRKLEEHMAPSHEALARLLKVEPGNIAFVPNATTGVNIVARSLRLEPGDEILSTNHEYGAIDRTWRFMAGKTGAVYRNLALSDPLTTHAALVEELWGAVTDGTRVISISHITSPTALILPVAEICRRAREAGILTIIDGAHAPGQIDLDLEAIGADFYTGNCHKWLCAPKGAAFLYARPEVQDRVEPLVVSWGYEAEQPSGSTFQDYLRWVGTRDVSAYLSIAAAIKFQSDHNWPRVRKTCHQLLLTARGRLLDLIGEPPLIATTEPWLAQMVSVWLPEDVEAAPLWARLWEDYRVEVPVWNWNGRVLMRVSIQAYNTVDDVDRLLAALSQILT